MSTLSLRNADGVLTPPEDGLPFLRHDRARELRLDRGAVTVRDGKIAAFDDDPGADHVIDASGCTIIPGFVNCHTHIPFAGWRSGEYAMKVAGRPYEEIARAGGGIASSARALAERSDEQVMKLATDLAEEMLTWGTTSFETKCGYGLSIEAERRSLKLADQLAGEVTQDLVSTGLIAHAVPEGQTPDGWLDEVEAAMPDLLAARELAALDIYVESVAFTNKHLERVGILAQEHGLELRAHVEQFATHRSVPVALAHGARSVDHLACLHPDDVKPLAEAECGAVLLPGAEFLGAERVAPGRELADAGAICVLATDANPGTSPVVSMPVIIGLAVRRYGWTALEALLAGTLNAAWVIGQSQDKGSIEVGKQADLVLLDGDPDMIPYRFGHNPVMAVIADGEVVHMRDLERMS